MQLFFELAASFIIGVLMGVAYFGSMWLTVRKLPELKQPAVLMAVSYLVRMVVVVVVFVLLVRGGNWERLLSALVGFVLARIGMVHRLRPEQDRAENETQRKEE